MEQKATKETEKPRSLRLLLFNTAASTDRLAFTSAKASG